MFDGMWCHHCYLICVKGSRHTWHHSDRQCARPLLLPSSPQRIWLWGLNSLRDSVLADFLNLGALFPAGVLGLSGGGRLLTLAILIMDEMSSVELPPPRISLHGYQPAALWGRHRPWIPVLLLPWAAWAQEPGFLLPWDATHPARASVTAAYRLLGSCEHWFLRAPGDCHLGRLFKVCRPTCSTLHPSCLLPRMPEVNSAQITFWVVRLPLCSQSFLLLTACLRSCEQAGGLQRREWC